MTAHPNSPNGRGTPVRRTVSIPAYLACAIARRIAELQRITFSQHAIETTCFDLRIRRAHAITAQFALEPPEVQDAIDRLIDYHYLEGMERNGGTLRKLIFDTLPPIHVTRNWAGPLIAEKRRVFYPALLIDIIEERWQELGFANLSEYVTSVMRYDLLLGGQHLYFRAGDCTPEMLTALDRETRADFFANLQPQIMADRLLEEAAGMKLTREECDILLRAIGKKLRGLAIEYFL